MSLSPEEATFFVNHLFLPPKVPNGSDEERAAPKLLTLFATAARSYGQRLDPAAQLEWSPIAKSLGKWRDVYQNGMFCETRIVENIEAMHQHSTLLLFFKSQNAAVLITKLESSYKFEAWEVSATLEDVIATKDSLLRQYPALAVHISDSTMKKGNFIHHLANSATILAEVTYAPLSNEKTFKGNIMIEEIRQSNNPRLVTEALFTILASCGHSCITKSVQKRVRDEVNFNTALLPWHRSSVWSCMKVALQLTIHNSQLADPEHKHYKQFMIYFLSDIAKKVFSYDHITDYHQVLRTKVARRASKLQPDVPDFVSAAYTSVIKSISTQMEKQWSVSKLSDTQYLPIVRVGKYNKDLKLTKVTPHLKKLLKHATNESAQKSPDSNPPRSVAFSLDRRVLPEVSIFNYSPDTLASEENKSAAMRRRKEVLIVFQRWVAKHLEGWLAQARTNSATCEQLKSLIERFWQSSRDCFSPYAELMSGVLLTIFELWVALDKLTVKLCPLILDYSPEIPTAVFTPLLLRKYNDMVRIQRLELYIEQRMRNARLGPLFDRLTANSLSVRLYDRSQASQNLMSELENLAQQEKEKVRAKFKDLRSRYEKIMASIEDQEHDYFWPQDGPDVGLREHSGRCRRCKSKGWALNVKIERYEEILPESLPMRKAVVYELQPAQEVVNYRDCLWFILRDILGRDTTKFSGKLYGVRDFNAFKSLTRTLGRVSLASAVKPHSMTHRHLIKVTTSVETIFHPHSMNWVPADLSGYTGVTLGALEKYVPVSSGQTELLKRDYSLSLAQFVRVQLGDSPYTKLADTVHNIGISQNNVMARQSSCPAGIHVSEWCAFGSMRHGRSLQLINLLRAMLAKELDLTTSATMILVEQMLHEAGHPAESSHSVLRTADIDIREPTYVDQLLRLLSETLESIADNWKEHVCAWICLIISQRVLTLNKDHDPQISTRILQLIRDVRQIGLRWVRRLTDLHDTQREQEMSAKSTADTRRRILEVALLTRAT